MINSAFSRDIPNSNSREVIRPSADLLYSGCGFDVTYKPLIITSSLPESYWSMSFFSSNTDNFSTINENMQKDSEIKIWAFFKVICVEIVNKIISNFFYIEIFNIIFFKQKF